MASTRRRRRRRGPERAFSPPHLSVPMNTWGGPARAARRPAPAWSPAPLGHNRYALIIRFISESPRFPAHTYRRFVFSLFHSRAATRAIPEATTRSPPHRPHPPPRLSHLFLPHSPQARGCAAPPMQPELWGTYVSLRAGPARACEVVTGGVCSQAANAVSPQAHVHYLSAGATSAQAEDRGLGEGYLICSSEDVRQQSHQQRAHNRGGKSRGGGVCNPTP